jgi:hypothetical protein
MRGYVEYSRILLEDVLCAVAVMDVEIDNGDPSHPHRDRVCRSDRDVIVETEAHRAIALRMVARRPHQCERPTVRAGHDALDAVDSRARSESSDLERVRRRIRVGVQCHRDTGGLADQAQMFVVMHAGQLFAGRLAWRDEIPAIMTSPFGRDGVHHLGPLGALGMT